MFRCIPSSRTWEILRNVKDTYNHEERTGIYNIPLQNVDNGTEELYIGATCKNLKERLAEHKRDIKNANLMTALVKSAYESNVSIRWEESKVTKQIINIDELFTAESIQIYKGKPNTIIINNRQVDSIQKPWRYLLN